MGYVVLRWPLPLAIAGLMAVPAAAADQSVTAGPDFSFSPSEVTVDLGDKVTWSNGGGFHNVKFDDGSFEQPGDPELSQWSVERAFDAPGHHRYYCEQHGGPNGSGMAGTVHVRDAAGSVPEPEPKPPGLTVSAPAEQSLERLLGRGVRPQLRCENGCDVTLALSLDRRTAKRFGFRKRRTVVGDRTASLAAGRAGRVTVALTDRARRKLRSARRPFRIRLDVRAANDTSETARRTVAIKP